MKSYQTPTAEIELLVLANVDQESLRIGELEVPGSDIFGS